MAARFVTAQTIEGGAVTPPEAHAHAVSGAVFLIDIRRSDEWATTESGQGARRLDLRRQDFVTALDAMAACAVGNHVRREAADLTNKAAPIGVSKNYRNSNQP